MEGGLSKLSSLEMIPFEVFGTVEGDKIRKAKRKNTGCTEFLKPLITCVLEDKSSDLRGTLISAIQVLANPTTNSKC